MLKGARRAAACAALALLGCRTEERAPTPASELGKPPAPRSPASTVLYGGCYRERLGSVCEVTAESQLSLWREDSFGNARVSIGERVIPVSETPVAGGHRVVIPASVLRARTEPAPNDASLGELRVSENGQDVLHLVLLDNHDSAALRDANAAKNAGDSARALQLVSEITKRAEHGTPDTDAVEPILARGVAGRVALRAGRIEEAADILESTSQALYERGHISEAARDVLARLYILSQQASRPAEAAAWLARWQERLSMTPLNTALLTENEGLLAHARDEPVVSLRRYQAAELTYRRLGEAAHARRATNEIIKLLGEIGQVRRAWEQIEELGPPPAPAPACDHALYWSLRAWLNTQVAQEGGLVSAASVERVLADSASWQERCHDPVGIGLDLIVQGLRWLHVEKLDRAAAAEAALTALIDAEKGGAQAILLRTWTADLRGQLALATGRLREAREHFRHELELAGEAENLDPSLRAHIGLATVALRMGSLKQADVELAQAIARLEQAERWEAFGSLLHTQISSRQRSARLLVQQLVQRGELDTAFEIALQSHGAASRLQARQSHAEALSPGARQEFSALYEQYMAGLQRLDDASRKHWTLPSNELLVARERESLEARRLEELLQRALGLLPEPAREAPVLRPPTGQYWIVLMPSVSVANGWIVLGRGASARAATSPGDVIRSPQARGSTHPALEPFEKELLAAREIVVFAGGESSTFDIGSWLLDDKPLLSYRMAFGAGLAPSSAPDPAARPLIVADPTGDLPFARREAEIASTALGASRDRVLVGDAASAQSLLEMMPGTNVLHFAGHVRHDSTSGEPALVMAEHSLIETWELFGVPRVPRFAVLSACRAGDAAGATTDGGYDLARALLALGTEAVIAPLTDVRDEDALRFQERFYRAFDAAQGDFREAFWQAQHDSVRDRPAFRLFQR